MYIQIQLYGCGQAARGAERAEEDLPERHQARLEEGVHLALLLPALVSHGNFLAVLKICSLLRMINLLSIRIALYVPKPQM